MTGRLKYSIEKGFAPIIYCRQQTLKIVLLRMAKKGLLFIELITIIRLEQSQIIYVFKELCMHYKMHRLLNGTFVPQGFG